MARWMVLLVAAYAVVFILVAWLVGESEFIIPYAILGVLIVGFALAHLLIERNVLARHGGSYEAAISDEQEPIPSAPDIPDDRRPTGDTPEAHDEISPHDLPADHPGRHAAEAQAATHGGTTPGNVEGGASKPGDELVGDEEEHGGARLRPSERHTRRRP